MVCHNLPLNSVIRDFWKNTLFFHGLLPILVFHAPMSAKQTLKKKYDSKLYDKTPSKIVHTQIITSFSIELNLVIFDDTV